MEYEEVEVNSKRWFDLTPLKNEEFRPIKNYEGLYEVSNYGRVKSLGKNKGWCKSLEKIMKISFDKDGYCRITLCKSNKYYNFGIHRLVAKTFLPNFNNYKEVNHIDMNKTNNVVSNLEWCNQNYNLHYGNRNEKISKALSKPIIQYTKDNEKIKEFESINQASKELKLSTTHISQCCRNIKYHKTCGGYIWKYKEEKNGKQGN